MKKSLKAFMKGIIDYAGLFPPADLSLEEAIQNYADYRTRKDAWMLSRFIIPASQLADVSAYAEELFSKEIPFSFSVLGKGTDTLDDFGREIGAANSFCDTFCSQHPGRVTTDLLEIKLPKEVALSHDADLLTKLMNRTAQKLHRSKKTPSMIFYEGMLEEGWVKDIEAIMEAIALHNKEVEDSTGHYRFAAFKLRCGGVEAHHFPSVEQVAFVLQMARKYNVALKGTAGLHHPVRHYAEEVQTKMHGFFNVFGGAMLGYAHDLTAEELEEVLSEEDAEKFIFTDEAFKWKSYAVSTREIKELRKTALLSYGSCSFEEPIEDLKKLNLF